MQKLIATQIQRQKQNRTQALSITTKKQPQMITQKLMSKQKQKQSRNLKQQRQKHQIMKSYQK